MHLLSLLIATLAAVDLSEGVVTRSVKGSSSPTLKNGKYVIDGHAFSNKAVWTFSGSTLPEGLFAGNYRVDKAHSYTKSNVVVQNGYLELIVPGGQTKKPYKGAEIITDVDNIKFASVRTTAILSEPAGVCNGMFFYQSDTQETDIEWLSDATSQSNRGTRKLWFTNQDANGDGKVTHKAVTPPSDPTSSEHEYRIDWTKGLTKFYIDGVKIWQTTKDVPSQSGPWVWNNWSNGDKGWTVGPPTEDAIFKIKKIEMYYNTA